MSKFTIVQGHPDGAHERLNAALAERYAEAATAAGHEVRRIDVSRLDFPLLRSAADFYDNAPPQSILDAQRDIAWADRVAFFYPLWVGDVPALFKGFIEQTFRPGFALKYDGKKRFPQPLFRGKSARIVVTMGMPALIYQTYFGSHTVKSLALNLRMCGMSPVHETYIGGVGAASESTRAKWLAGMELLAKNDGEATRPDRARPVKLVASAALVAATAYALNAALTWVRIGKSGGGDSLLQTVMPEYDVRLHHEVEVRANLEITFEAMHHASFERSPIVQALFRLREMLVGASHVDREMPADLTEALESVGWSTIASESGKELVFGAVTEPWQASPVFRSIGADEFARFNTPGYAKIAFSLRVDPIDANSCIARTETRVHTTDRASRGRFRQYWALVSPGVELIRIVLLQQIKSEAEKRQRQARSPVETANAPH